MKVFRVSTTASEISLLARFTASLSVVRLSLTFVISSAAIAGCYLLIIIVIIVLSILLILVAFSAIFSHFIPT